MLNIIFFILFNIDIIYSLIEDKNNSNFISLKFRTYYPYSSGDSSSFGINDYYQKVHLSKIYLELYTGNENSFKLKQNQTLNTIMNLKEGLFITTNDYFKQNNTENNYLLYNYNNSK